MEIDIVFSFDMTSSMTPCIYEVKAQLTRLVSQIFDSIDASVRVALITHGDYDSNRYLIQQSDFMSSSSEFSAYVSSVENAGFNMWNDGEAYEKVLSVARALPYRDFAKKVLVVIGDDIPHPPTFPGNSENLDWREELANLRSMNITTIGIQCPTLSTARSQFFYSELSSPRNTLLLRQFPYIVDFMTAIIYSEMGTQELESFGERLISEGRYTMNMHETIETLMGVPSSLPVPVQTTASVLGDPLPPNKFQTLTVTEKCSIRDFVESTGAVFKTGRGFYQLSKPETVSAKKELVLYEHITANMFSGPGTRAFIGLTTDKGKLKPKDIPEGFTLFIQSTSVNRSLVPNTTFLYEL